MLCILVTLEVFQEERSSVKVVALLPAEENMLAIFVTLAVFQEERLPTDQVVALLPALKNM